MSATRLDQSHAALIQGFLERDPVANLFALGALEQWAVERNPSVEWWGTMGPDGELDALVFAEGHRVGLGYALVVPMGCAEALADMAPRFSERDGASWMVGEAAAADAIAASLSEAEPAMSRRQLLMVLEETRPGPTVQIRQAIMGDLCWVTEAARAVNDEDLGTGIIDMDGMAFSRKVEGSIASGSEWLGTGRSYRAKVGTRCAYGAQLGGVWVPPPSRGRGLGQFATRALCQELLRGVPRITLHVGAENARAIRCYEAVGFQPVRDFRLWVR